MDNEIKELLDKHFTDYKKLDYGFYEGQLRDLRELAIEKFGIDNVVDLDDNDIELLFASKGLIPLSVSKIEGYDSDIIYLIPIQDLDKYNILSR